jgi:hypothetical protein
MNFINNLKALFRAGNDDANPIAVCDAFSAARSRYEQFQEGAKSYTTRAKHRLVIMRARYRHDQIKDADAYEREVAAYTDPAGFAPYTEAELDAYTGKMENLTADFDTFTAAFIALKAASINPDDEFYITASACFNVYCETYKDAAGAYKIAALSVIATATAAKAQALKDGAKAWLKDIAVNPDAEVKTTEGEIKAELFQERPRLPIPRPTHFFPKSKKSWENDA